MSLSGWCIPLKNSMVMTPIKCIRVEHSQNQERQSRCDQHSGGSQLDRKVHQESGPPSSSLPPSSKPRRGSNDSKGSPSKRTYFTEYCLPEVIEELKTSSSSFEVAAKSLVNWFAKGECKRQNSSSFFAMVQTVKNHLKRLEAERGASEKSLARAQSDHDSCARAIVLRIGLISQVLDAATQKKAWPHFTRAQRKSIAAWRTEACELYKAQLRKVISEREEDAMDLSDDEGESSGCSGVVSPSQHRLRQLIQVASRDKSSAQSSEISSKCRSEFEDRQVQETVQPPPTESQLPQQAALCPVAELKSENDHLRKELDMLRTTLHNVQHQMLELQRLGEERPSSKSFESLIEDDVRLVVLISFFLRVHPKGSPAKDICSHLLCHYELERSEQSLARLMRGHTDLFYRDSKSEAWSLIVR